MILPLEREAIEDSQPIKSVLEARRMEESKQRGLPPQRDRGSEGGQQTPPRLPPGVTSPGSTGINPGVTTPLTGSASPNTSGSDAPPQSDAQPAPSPAGPGQSSTPGVPIDNPSRNRSAPPQTPGGNPLRPGRGTP
jgi:hypothetical protein